ncbi:MAG: type pantothenate kinase [Actinomycetota bacterium]|nr:type pantothenate kinase [Actinomycetota bacterium]
MDVGNTQTVIGIYALDSPDLLDHWRTATNPERTSDEYALLLGQFLDLGGFDIDTDVSGLAVSSTVPRVTAAIDEMTQRHLGFRALILGGAGVRSGMPILYENPREVGPDRIADAVGAYDLYGGPSIVIDFGTATTVEAVSGNGEYLGGAICPGIEISLDALFGRAAALHRVALAEPRNVIGKTTNESSQSGGLSGYAAMVDGLCERVEREIGDATVVATGGLAELIAPYTKAIDHIEPWLTLRGLRIIFERNRTDK